MATNPVTPYDKISDVFIIQDQTTKQNKARSFPEIITAHKSTTAQAQAGVDDTTLITPLKLNEGVTAILANPAAPIPAAVTAALLGKEDVSNKKQDFAFPSATTYPSTQATYDLVISQKANVDGVSINGLGTTAAPFKINPATDADVLAGLDGSKAITSSNLESKSATIAEATAAGTSTTNKKLINKQDLDAVIASIPAAPATNLTNTAAPTKVTINSSTGTPTDVPLADATNAGLLAPAEKAFINSNHSQFVTATGTIEDTNPDGSKTNAVANWGSTTDFTTNDSNLRFYTADATANKNGTMQIPAVKAALGITAPQNNLAASSTLAPTVDAVNQGLATKINGVKVDGVTLVPDALGYVNVTDNDVTGIADSSSIDLTLTGTVVAGVIKTTNSVTTNGDTTAVQLVGDSATPGNNKFYGTSATGVKGFISLPASAVSDQVSILGDGNGTPFKTAFADVNVTNAGTDTITSINTQELKNQIQTNQYKRGIAQLTGQSGNVDTNGTTNTDIYVATLDYPITALEDNQEFILSFDGDSQTIVDPNDFSLVYQQYLDMGTGFKSFQIETRDAGTPFRDVGLLDIRKNSVHTVVYNKVRDIFQLVDPSEAKSLTSSVLEQSTGVVNITDTQGNTGQAIRTGSELQLYTATLGDQLVITNGTVNGKVNLSQVKTLLENSNDLFRTGTGTTLPDGVNDTLENASRLGKTGFGVIDASTVKSNLETQGSFGANMVETNVATYTVLDTDHTIFLLGLNQVINLPVAATVLRRIIVISNSSSTPASTNLGYSNIATGLSTTVIPGNSTVMIQAGPGAWRQINNRGTVAPIAGTYSNTSANDKSLFYDLATLTNKQIDRLNIQNTVGIGAFTMTASTAETILIANTTAAITNTFVAGAFVGQNLIFRNTSGQQVAILPALTDITTSNLVVNNNQSYVAVWDGVKWVQETNLGIIPGARTKRLTQPLSAFPTNNSIAHGLNLTTPFNVEVTARDVATGQSIAIRIVPSSQTANAINITSATAFTSASINIIEIQN
jgi:hypothetical protein